MFSIISQPASLQAGLRGRIVVRYTHAGEPLAKGASIRMGYNAKSGAGTVQTTDPRQPHYLCVSTNAQATVEPVIPVVSSSRSITHFPATGMNDITIFEINVAEGNVRAGDFIDIFLGGKDDTGGGFVAAKCCDSPFEMFYHIDPDNRYPLKLHHPDAKRYWQYLSADGEGYPEWKSCGFEIPINPLEPLFADIIVPSIIGRGAEVDMRVVIYDRLYNHIKDFHGELTLLSENTEGIRISRNNFTTGTQGYSVVPVAFQRLGTYQPLLFSIPGLGKFHCNPFKVVENPGKKIFWGDLHGHSALSDGGRCGPEFFFNYAKNITGLDFAALADHAFGLAVKGHWDKLLRAIKKFSSRDFVAILGYEIMPQFGHRNVYFPGLDAKLIMADYQPGCGGSFAGENIGAYKRIWDPKVEKIPTKAKAIEALKMMECIYTAHHCGEVTSDERDFVTLYEASSEWGVSDSDTGAYQNSSTAPLCDIFKQGLSPGLMGGSDDHNAKAGFKGKAVCEGPICCHSGLIAVIADSLDRQSIYDALSNKHCYGTTGARILLDVEVARRDTHLAVKLDVTGTDVLDQCRVFKNGLEVFGECADTGKTYSLQWSDENFSPQDTCYIRVRQIDGELAWINPLPLAKSETNQT